jgi:hypothetical protein
MRILVLFLLLGLTAFAAAPTPAAVDSLAPDDVGKAIDAVKENFVQPGDLSDQDLQRATLQGLLDRLAPEVTLVTGSASAAGGATFYSELYQGKTGYLRIAEVTPDNIAKARQALDDWTAKSVPAVVLDLRATPGTSDYASGADLARLFCAKGTELFSLAPGKKGAISPAATPAASPGSLGSDSGVATAQTFSVTAAPAWQGLLVVLVNDQTSETAETVAAVLQKCSKALLVGNRTAGGAFAYRDYPLGTATLRVAVARVVLPDGKEPGEQGLNPDIVVDPGADPIADLMQTVTQKGVDSVVQEYGLPHLNEAALVAGSNPEIDELEAESSGKTLPHAMVDRQLQRALDLITSITVFQAKKE